MTRIAFAALVLVAAACHGGTPAETPQVDPIVTHLVGCAIAPSIPKIPTEDHVDIGGSLDGSSMDGGFGYGTIGTLGGTIHGYVAVGAATVTGYVGELPVRRYLREHVPQLADCYTELLKKDPKVRGSVVAKFSLAADGKPANIETTGPADLAACVRTELAAIAIAKPPAPIAMIEYPISFDTGASSPTSILVDGETTEPWTPFAAFERELDEARGAQASRAAEAAIRTRQQELDACFTPKSTTGSMRAMLTVVQNGAVTGVRVGGLGDAPLEHCVGEVLGDLHLVVPPGGFTELACDLGRGDAQPWRIASANYQVIEVTPAGVTFGDQTIVAHAEDPEPLPSSATYLIAIDPKSPGENVGLATRWAAEGDVTLLALRDPKAGLVFLGAARNTLSVDEAEDESVSPHPSLVVRGTQVTACVESLETHARIADPTGLETMLKDFASQCRRRQCATTLGIAQDADVAMADLATLTRAVRRAGFDRVLLGAFSTCRMR